MELLTLLFAIGVLFSTGNCSCEDTHNDQYSDICREIFQSLEDALIRDKGNQYRSNKVFFYAPNADPVLLRINYSLAFAENITDDLLPYCTNKSSSVSFATLNETKWIIRGWTSRRLYRLIEPLLLNGIQMMLPFFILRRIGLTKSMSDNPEMKTFLWDGSTSTLPTLLINLKITSLPCIPSEEIFNSTIEDLTAFLKVYASQGYQDVSNTLHNEDIGFALSEDAISTLPSHSLVPSYLVLYDAIGYIVIMLAYIIYINNNKANPMPYHENILLSTVIIGSALTVFECILIGILRHNIFITKQVFTFKLVTVITYIIFFITYVTMYLKSKKVGNMFYTFHIAVYLLLVYFYALPTFFLLLVYPMKVITIFAYLITAVFVTIMVCSIYVLAFKQCRAWLKLKIKTRLYKRMILSFLYALSIFIVAFFSLYLIIIYPFVVLTINQSSFITTGPVYTILSLIPSAALSLVTWMLKNKFLQFDITEGLQNARSAEDTTDCEQSPSITNDSNADTEEERIPLLTVASTESNRGSGHEYGATKDEDKSNDETNC